MDGTYMNGFLGGMLIGAAALILFYANGRIMGVSGICSRILARPNADTLWRAAFIAGLIAGGFVVDHFYPVKIRIDASMLQLISAGLLVGFGTVLGSGCTSGHGVCGLARLSPRSICATAVFMAAGMLTVWLMGRCLG